MSAEHQALSRKVWELMRQLESIQTELAEIRRWAIKLTTTPEDGHE